LGFRARDAMGSYGDVVMSAVALEANGSGGRANGSLVVVTIDRMTPVSDSLAKERRLHVPCAATRST
jgi:hypothetical protein